MITPEMLAAPNTESAHQKALFCWASLPEQRIRFRGQLDWLHAIPNGGKRDNITASRMKAEGSKAGVWDIFLPVAVQGRHGLYIEMKHEKYRNHKAKGLSSKQIEFGDFAAYQGFATAVCFSWIEAKQAIETYLYVL